MSLIRVEIILASVVLAVVSCSGTPPRGVRLQELTWPEAERALTPKTIVVIPLGAASKEHGHHLRLETDLLLAERLTERVLDMADVVVAPTVQYSYYPSFVEYPGSTHLRLETARDTIVDLCTGLARFGPRRFYVLNTGVSTRHPLKAAEEILAASGIRMRWTNLLEVLGPIEAEVAEQTFGTHADEIETSILLAIAPHTVDMSKAVRDGDEQRGQGLTRDPANESATYSPSGVFGDATLASRTKGERVWEHWVASVLREIEELRAESLPGEQR